jgi:hypothetical protein
MERMKHWRVAPSRASRVHRRSNGGRRLRAAVAAGAMVAVAMPVLSADAAVGGRRSIEATTTSDLVLLSGYPRGAEVLIKVFRKGTVVGFATKRAFGGEIELNHAGGSDCWESPRTPNIRPGDKIQTRILGSGIRDSSVVRGVFVNAPDFNEAADTITVSGRVRLGTGRASVNPGRDVLELRINKDDPWGATGRSDLRVEINANVAADGSWTRTLDSGDGIDGDDVGQAAASSETVLEWSNPGASELTVAEPPGPALRLPGCPRVEAN